MAGFTPINGNGAHFAQQLAEGPDHLDVWAVFGLPANGPALDHRALRSHYRTTLMPHVFERGTASGARTQGPEIPTWQQANQAKDILFSFDQAGLRDFQTAWKQRSRQTWNPFAPPGAPEAFVPVGVTARLPAHLYATVEDAEDDHDPAENVRGAGSADHPFFFDSDDDPMHSTRASDAGPSSSAGPSSAAGPSAARPDQPETASSQSRRPTYDAKPGTPQKRRHVPGGIFLGTWLPSGLPASQANAVYGSRDAKNRINRRVSKETVSGQVVVGGNYNSKITSCKHADVAYIPKFQGMTEEEVRSHIMPLLATASPGEYGSQPETPSKPKRPRPAPFQTRGARFFGASDGTQYLSPGEDPFA